MTFSESLSQGVSHITDFEGYDHMVFLVALCAVYEFNQLKRVAWLVTAFTLGHSITLIFASLESTSWLRRDIIEFLIPVTIIFTCFYNLIIVLRRRQWNPESENPFPKYLIAAIFGLIHGFGFSNYFRMITMEGEGYIANLFGFNLGVEIGQLIIVFCLLFLSSVFMKLFKLRQRDWTILLSGIAMGISLLLIKDTWPF